MNLILINSASSDPFCALYTGNDLTVSRVSDFVKNTDGEKTPRQQDKLINCLHRLAVEKRSIFDQIDALSVVTGPGSFTGIRVGIAMAKGISLALNKKIIPVTNFELTLSRIPDIEPGKKYCVLIPAKFVPAGFKQVVSQYYYAFMQGGKELSNGYIQISDISLILDAKTPLVGDFDDETEIKLNYFNLIDVKEGKSEPDSMLELSIKYYNEGRLFLPEKVEPLYIKDFIVKKHP